MSRNRSQQHGSQASQTYSPAGQISRTPSADRNLLRTLTVTPTDDDYTHPPPVFNKGPHATQQASAGSNHPPPVFNKKQKTPTPTPTPVRDDTPGRQTAQTAQSQARDSYGRQTAQSQQSHQSASRNDPEEITLDEISMGRQTAQSQKSKTPTASYGGGTAGQKSPSVHVSLEDSVAAGQSQRSPSVHVSIQDSVAAASRKSSRVVVELPGSPVAKPQSTRKGSTEEDWQSNKSVSESNSYMLKYEVASDVTFAVGENKEEIRAHKYMLMARSPVLFRSLVRHLGNTDVKIGVPDIKPEVFREMLHYIYTDEFDINNDNVSAVLFAAKKFQLKGLSDLCFQFLASELSDATVAKVMEQAHIYNEANLFERCTRFIFANGDEVLRNPAFGQLCAECLEKIVKSDDLRASEEAVFEGCVNWANAECRRQKIQPTDEARRDVLGKTLYLIRFPLMGVTYFTQKVSLGEMLTHDEKLSIFQYYHGEEQQLPQRFSRTERKQTSKDVMASMKDFPSGGNTYTTGDTIRKQSPIMDPSKARRVRRFRTTDGMWKQNGPPDAISFTTSKPIVLYGVEIFGSCKGTDTYQVKLYVYDDISRQEIRKNEENIYSSPKKDTYDVFLARPLRVPAGRVFTAVVAMKGGATHKGVDGEAVHSADGVTFEFIDSNRSSNGSDVTVGQISGLLFNQTQ